MDQQQHQHQLPERLALLLRNQHSRMQQHKSSQSLLGSLLCSRHPRRSTVIVDVFILLLVLCSCGFLILPYLRYARIQILPHTLAFVGEVFEEAPIVFSVSLAVAVAAVTILAWETLQDSLSRCKNPNCRGLRGQSMDFDIQIEPHEASRAASSLPGAAVHPPSSTQKQLEAELKRLAPPNGRAVLTFRAPCGCPAARFEGSSTGSIARKRRIRK